MKSKIFWTVVLILVALVAAGAIVWYISYESAPGQYDQFAECISQSGATFYGAFWCPHCQAQKALFGKSAEKLPYVECSTPDGSAQTQVCIDKGIQGYPTWYFANGTSTEGELSFAQLSNYTGCAVPQ